MTDRRCLLREQRRAVHTGVRGVCGKLTVCLVMGWNILKPRGFRAAPLVVTADKASYRATWPCVRPQMGTDQRGMATSERQRGNQGQPASWDMATWARTMAALAPLLGKPPDLPAGGVGWKEGSQGSVPAPAIHLTGQPWICKGDPQPL